MVTSRPRWVAGTVRRRLVATQRRARARWTPCPRTSPLLPRPARARRDDALRLTHALVASDLNAAYLGFWPLVERAWRDLVQVEPILVLVASAHDVPTELRNDERVRVFEPIPGLHTAFQAQCIRLLYPALLDTGGAVATSDIDMLPLAGRYFHEPLRRVRRDAFVAYRDTLLSIGQIPICYNAALPATWAELFEVATSEDVRARLAAWGGDADYAGARGGAGWDTDQEILHRSLLDWGGRTRRAWILDDDSTGFRRLERAELSKPRSLSPTQRERLRRGAYSDYHALPFDDLGALNEEVLELANSRGGRARGRRA